MRDRNWRRTMTRRYQKRQIRLFYKFWADEENLFAPAGHYRKHSFADCCISRCYGCDNPRRFKGPASERLTLQERKHEDVWKDYMYDL